MEIEKLKQKILDLAIRGKLVPQDPNDEPASVLIDRIRAQKEELIKQGKIKRSKEDSYIYKGSDNCYYEKVGNKTTCINEEIPFEIPDNWTWARLKTITNNILAGGDRPAKYAKQKNEDCVIPIYSNGVENDGLYGYTDKPVIFDKSITVSARGTIGFSCIRTEPFVPIIRLITIIPNSLIDIDYLYLYFNGKQEKGEGTSTPQLTVPMINNKLIAVPPIKEQINISLLIKKVLKIISILEKDKTTLSEMCCSAKNKILDDIFGENSRYKSYYTQTQEKLENIASLITKGSTPTSYGFQYVDKGISFVKVENVHDYYIDHTTIRQFITVDAHEFQKRSQLQENDMLFSIAGTIGRICLIKTEDLPANTNQAFAIIRGYDKILIPSYLKWYLTWYLNDKSKLSGHGGGMLNITLNDLKKLEVFYPINKNDQQILVDRVEKLMEVLSSIS